MIIDDVTKQVLIEQEIIDAEKVTFLGSFASGMAHEINNPIGGILQNSQNISRRLDCDAEKNKEVADDCGIKIECLSQYIEKREIRHFLSNIIACGHRASDVVKKVIAFSESSDGRYERLNLNDVIKEALAIISTDHDIKHKLESKQVSLMTHLDENLPELMISQSDIMQVVICLIKNAVQPYLVKILQIHLK